MTEVKTPETTIEAADQEPVTMIETPISMQYQFTAGTASSRFLRNVAQGKLVGQRCPRCRKVYIPPRGSCPTCGVPTEEEVALSDRGTVTTFCIVNVPFSAHVIDMPYVAATILLDGADIGFQHLIQEIPAAEVRVGLRVEAVWKDSQEWGPTMESIKHFRPTGEPDAVIPQAG